MYGFCRLGVRPAPSTVAVCVSNGLATATSTNAKNDAMPPSTGTTHAVSSRSRLRFSATASPPKPVSTSSHRSRDPSCPPQNALSAYGVDSVRFVCAATYENEKSCRTSATARTAAATAVDPNAQKSALRAENASRRRFVTAATEPATSAYSTSPKLTTRAARPRSAIYVDLLAGVLVYFDGHFVTTLSPARRPCA